MAWTMDYKAIHKNITNAYYVAGTIGLVLFKRIHTACHARQEQEDVTAGIGMFEPTGPNSIEGRLATLDSMITRIAISDDTLRTWKTRLQ